MIACSPWLQALFLVMEDLKTQPIEYVNAGVNAVGTLASGLFGSHARKMQYRTQKKLMQYQSDLNREAFDYENAYNHPTRQRERLEQAGLNPMFYGIDGQGTATLQPANASEAMAAATEAQSLNETRRNNIMNMIQQGIAMASQLKVNNSQAAKNDADAALASEQASFVDFQKKVAEADAGLKVSQKTAIDTGLESENAIKKWDAIRKQFEGELLIAQLNNPDVKEALVKLPVYERDKLLKDIAVRDAEALLTHKEVQLTSARIRESIAEAGLKGALREQALRYAEQIQALEKLYKSQRITEVKLREEKKKLLQKQIEFIGKQSKYYRTEQLLGFSSAIIGVGPNSIVKGYINLPE